MTVTNTTQWLQAFSYRDSEDYPYDAEGNRLPLELDPDFLWTTEPNDYTCSGSAYQLSYNRGAY